MPSLARACCEFLKGQLCAENCLGIASFADAYFRSGLRKVSMHFAYRHFNDLVTRSQEFLELDVSTERERERGGVGVDRITLIYEGSLKCATAQ